MPHKRVSKQIARRIEHKQERAAVRQALDGGNPRQSPNDKWDHRSSPIPIVGDHPSTGRKKRPGCPKNKGGDHAPVLKARYYGQGEYRHVWYDTVCDFCGKRRWGHSNKGWGATPKSKPPRHIYLPYAVCTDSGIVCSRHGFEESAQDRCDEANFDAEILDIGVRYVVRYIV